MPFDELTASELAACREQVSAAALRQARLIAAERLADGPADGTGLDAEEVLAILLSENPDHELIRAFEARWAVLVIRILAEVADPAPAVEDAYARGVSGPAIGRALGVSHQTIYSRYREAVEAGRRRRG
ncbi:hypothetical protein ACNQVK_01090 [Mycobacterium sp. 134]|uniref:hypothetical protein n=1 Tax=Mycobacterium sp. 134 TaxID=3400425 RepID=UPI003AB04CB9